jgi:hypothetical protein
VTAVALEAFSAVLQNPTSGLEKIDMDFIRINDGVLVSFANALANNNKLRELSICECATEGFYHAATDSGWEAISNLLCDTSSIMGTYHSNHTLNMNYDCEIGGLGEHLKSLFIINRNYNNSRQAARHKIIMSHFSGSDIDLQPFVTMDRRILPFAIAWMTMREEKEAEMETETETEEWPGRSDGHSLLYQFIGSVPTLLEQ